MQCDTLHGQKLLKCKRKENPSGFYNMHENTWQSLTVFLLTP